MNTSPEDATQPAVLLAVFDILGFSSRIRDSSITTVRETYTELRRKTVERQNLRSLDLLPWGPGSNVQVPALLNIDVESVVFSDSVFAWVPLKRGFANPFLKWCCDFICEGLAMNVPIRAAISAGEAILEKDTNTYLGTPILDAHELEANQDWIGIAISEQAFWPPLIADIDPRLLMEYPVPVKKGVVTPVSIDWPRVWRERHGSCASDALLSLAKEQPAAAQKYYCNAAEFARHSQSNSNWFEGEQPDGALLRMRPYDEVVAGARHRETEDRDNKSCVATGDNVSS